MDDLTGKRVEKSIAGLKQITNDVDAAIAQQPPAMGNAIVDALMGMGVSRMGASLTHLPMTLLAYGAIGLTKAGTHIEGIKAVLETIVDKTDQRLVARANGGCECTAPECPSALPRLNAAVFALQEAYVTTLMFVVDAPNLTTADDEARTQAREVVLFLFDIVIKSELHLA